MLNFKNIIVTPLLICLCFSAFSADANAVRRGKVPKSGSKITICHIPPGNHANIHSMTISTNAWTTHQHHGDYLGYCHGRPTQIVTQKCIDTPTPTPTPPPDETPTPTPWVCGVAGPYLNLACTGTKITLQVGSANTAQNGQFGYLWSTDCPDGQFSDSHAMQPMLTLASSTQTGAPISCSVTLSLTAGGVAQASCTAIVTTTQCQKDCLNIINGTAKFDECGVCNGDGSSCNCVEYQIAGEITELTSNFSLQCGALDKLMKKLIHTSCASASQLAQIRKAMKKTCGSGKVQIRSIPMITGNCHTECTLCSNEVTKNNLSTLSKKIYNLSRQAIGLDAKCARRGVCKRSIAECRLGVKLRIANQRQIQALAKGVHGNSIESLSKIPGSTYSCTPK